MRGWQFLFTAIGLGLLALFLNSYAEPIIYRYYTPSVTPTVTPTFTSTPTITLSPTITLTPTITPTPAESYTPTNTSTPHVPASVQLRFVSSITPNPKAVFSPLVFSQAIDDNYQPINPDTVLRNPVRRLFAAFSYDNMNIGAQWSVLWWRGNDLVYFETKAWDDSTGGFYYAVWNPKDPAAWLPGQYEVQIFVDKEWKQSGTFTIEGIPPTAVRTKISIQTNPLTPSTTPTLRKITRTPWPTGTPTLTRTPWPTATPAPSRTRRPTITPTPTQPTSTPFPTVTRPLATITRTPYPTKTPVPTRTPRPTVTITVTRTPRPTITLTPTQPTPTRFPTVTRSLPTLTTTPWPTVPPLPSRTPRPTITLTPTKPTPTRFPTVIRPLPTPTRTPRPTVPR